MCLLRLFQSIFIAAIFVVSLKSYSSQSKLSCTLTELSLKNCPLHAYNHRFHLIGEKILVHNGIWRSIEKLNLIGEHTEWKQMELKKLDQDLFLEAQIWTAPRTEVEVQDLRWLIYKVDTSSKLTLLSDLVIQKRNKNLSSKGPSFIYDKKMSFGIYLKEGKPYKKYRGKEEKL